MKPENRTGSIDPMFPERYRVQRVIRETADTFTLDLVRPDGMGTPSFLPGQFNMIYVYGIGEVPVSISGHPDESDSLTHTVRAVGAVTQSLCGMRKGDMVGVRGPFGSGWPVREGRRCDIVLAAGGLGMAPLRPALYHLLLNRHDYGHIALLYGARTPSDLLFRKELEKWRGHLDIDVLVTVDRSDPEWHGNVGVVTSLVPRIQFDPGRTLAMICGPEVMMRFMSMEILKHGVDEGKLFVSMERNMKCGVGMCGHCQFGPVFVCREGPVIAYSTVKDWLGKREI